MPFVCFAELEHEETRVPDPLNQIKRAERERIEREERF